MLSRAPLNAPLDTCFNNLDYMVILLGVKASCTGEFLPVNFTCIIMLLNLSPNNDFFLNSKYYMYFWNNFKSLAISSLFGCFDMLKL